MYNMIPTRPPRTKHNTTDSSNRAISHSVKARSINQKTLITPLWTSPNKVKPKLEFLYHSIGGDVGAVAPVIVTSLAARSCVFERMDNIAFRENYLAIYVQKLR